MKKKNINKKANKKNVINSLPVGVKLRFLHWDKATGKLIGVSLKPYMFKLNQKTARFLKNNDFDRSLVLEIVNNDTSKAIVVIDKWLFTLPKRNSHLKELKLGVSKKLLKTKVPYALNYDNLKELHSDIIKIVKIFNKKLKWVDK